MKLTLELSVNDISVLTTYLQENCGITTPTIKDIQKELQYVFASDIKTKAEAIGYFDTIDTLTKQSLLNNQLLIS